MITILQGDWIERLRELPDCSVQCCVTSPPYWGLRDYGVAGQLGLEKTPEEYVSKVVAGFREVRRVLRDDGTIWVNLGDSYCGGNTGNQSNVGQRYGKDGAGHIFRRDGSFAASIGCKPKDMIGIPWMVAFALRADGWYLRSDIIWHKINPMPESVTDRPTKAHEYIFLLSKSQKYFYDAESVKEPSSPNSHARAARGYQHAFASQFRGSPTDHRFPDGKVIAPKANGRNSRMVIERAVGKEHSKPNPSRSHVPGVTPKSAAAGSGIKANESFHAAVCDLVPDRNKRTVWSVALAAYGEAHFATFPPDLIKPCILAGTSSRGCCPKCAAPWERIVESDNPSKAFNTGEDLTNGAAITGNPQTSDGLHRNGGGVYSSSKTLGWQPTCECDGVDRRIMNSPTGERAGDDPSIETGRAGLNRPRGENEGTRPITRYEQSQYAAQIKASAHRMEMEKEAGTAFQHYIRTDESGARPVPQVLLDAWINRGWLSPVTVPDVMPGFKPVPCTVLDPFFGAGTTGLVALELGRKCIGIELNADYIELAKLRCNVTPGLALA